MATILTDRWHLYPPTPPPHPDPLLVTYVISQGLGIYTVILFPNFLNSNYHDPVSNEKTKELLSFILFF